MLMVASQVDRDDALLVEGAGSSPTLKLPVCKNTFRVLNLQQLPAEYGRRKQVGTQLVYFQHYLVCSL